MGHAPGGASRAGALFEPLKLQNFHMDFHMNAESQYLSVFCGMYYI